MVPWPLPELLALQVRVGKSPTAHGAPGAARGTSSGSGPQHACFQEGPPGAGFPSWPRLISASALGPATCRHPLAVLTRKAQGSPPGLSGHHEHEWGGGPVTGSSGAASFLHGSLGPAPGLSSTGGNLNLGLHVMSATGPTGCCVPQPWPGFGQGWGKCTETSVGPKGGLGAGLPGCSWELRAHSHVLGHWVPHVHAWPSQAHAGGQCKVGPGRGVEWGGADSLEATPGFRRVQGKRRGLHCGLSSLWPWRRRVRRKPPDSGAVAALFSRSF